MAYGPLTMRYSIPLFLSILVLAAPSTASASDACDCSFGNDPIGLGDSSEGLPTNLRLFVGGVADRQSLSFAKIVNGSPEPVAFHFEESADGPGAPWMVPDALLEPMTTYEYIRGGFHHQFMTGTGEDLSAPTFTSARIESISMAGACEAHIGARLTTDGEVDDTAPKHLLTWRATFSKPAKVVYFPPNFTRYLGRMDIDDNSWDSCLSNFPAAELDTTFEATLVAFDWAGNASKEVTTSFQFAEGGSGCGCRMVEDDNSSTSGVFISGALALAVARRRKRGV
jgi:MYXO-CTERM domain-containing protein